MPTTREQAAEVKRHRGLVLRTARHYAQRCREPVDDLIQAGWVGFLRASARFQPGPDRSLGAYAKPFVRGAILRHLRDNSRLVRLPRSVQDRLAQLNKIEAATGNQATVGLGRRLGWSETALRVLQQAEQLERLDWLDPERCEGIAAMDDETDPLLPRAMAQSWLASIQQRHSQVVELVVLEGYSLRRTAGLLGISSATVRRRLHAGLEELRTRWNPAFGARGCSGPH